MASTKIPYDGRMPIYDDAVYVGGNSYGCFSTGSFETETRVEDAKCEYCARFGPVGQCAGCGAPNRPMSRRFRSRQFNDSEGR